MTQSQLPFVGVDGRELAWREGGGVAGGVAGGAAGGGAEVNTNIGVKQCWLDTSKKSKEAHTIVSNNLLRDVYLLLF